MAAHTKGVPGLSCVTHAAVNSQMQLGLKSASSYSFQALASIFFLFCPLIYFPILGRTAETQPAVATLAALIVVAALLVRTCYTGTISVFVLGSFAFTCLLVFHSLFFAQIVNWAELPKFLLGPFFFAVALCLAPYCGAWPLRIALAFLAMGGVLEVFSPSLYEILNTYISADRPGSEALSLRGLRYFTPEPTYAALSVFFLIVVNYFLLRTAKISRHAFRAHLMLLIPMLLLTFSSYAMALLFIMGVAYVIRGKNIVLSAASLAFTPLLVVLVFNSETRAGQLLRNISEVSWSNIVQTFFLAEPSFSTRVLSMGAAVQGFLRNPLGYGIGSFQAIYWRHFNELNWGWVRFHEVVGQTYLERSALQPQSYLTALVHDLGIFGVTAFAIFLWGIRGAWGSTATQAGFFLAAGFMLTVQAQLTNPIPWVSLGLMYALNCQGNLSSGRKKAV